MTHSVTTGQALYEQSSFSSIFRDWLLGQDDLGSAAGEWNRFTSAPLGLKIAPAWSASSWADPWWEEFKTFLPDGSSVSQCRQNVELLKTGQADVVITGQQPAIMGGPLYTLYKIASVIEAARWRREAGQPTVPIFWLGDDDQDVHEAVSGRIYDPARRCFLGVGDYDVEDAMMVGTVPSRVWDKGILNWLNGLEIANPLAVALTRIWQESVESGESTSRLFKKFVLKLFPESGLLIVSGNDSRLHKLAAPVYDAIIPRLETLKETVRQRGVALSEAGWHAQISDRSLDNPLYRVQGQKRLKIVGPMKARTGYADIRPGVMLRSLVQDWLFNPLATVVGPSELAYHVQLRPLYNELGIHRPALLPRLFGILTPGPEVGNEEEEDRPSAYEMEMVASGSLEGVRKEIAKYMSEILGLDEAAIDSRIEPLMKLLRGRITGFLDRQHDRVALDAKKEQQPWLAPLGKRQERVMSTGWAAALWGDTLIHNLKLAAYVFYKRGASGQWLDMMMKVDDSRTARARR